MITMKKIALLLVIALALTLSTSCLEKRDGGEETSTAEETATEVSTAEETVGETTTVTEETVGKTEGSSVEETTIVERISEQETLAQTETTAETTAEGETTAEEDTMVWELPRYAQIDKYDMKTALTDVWEGNIVYNESIMFVGDDDTASLMYTPKHIFSIRSYDLKTEYVEGVDYQVVDGKIVRCEGSSIPCMPLDTYYPKKFINGKSFLCSAEGHRFIYFGEGDTFLQWQVFVTYAHTDEWEGYIPEDQNSVFSDSTAKMEEGEAVKVLFFGDSITVGANASGFVGAEPQMPIWPQLVVDYLKEYYENPLITYTNTAVGGMDHSWGVQNVQERVIAYEPDLVVVGFGMNGAAASAEEHTGAIKQIVDEIHDALPNCEILVIATTLPNPEAPGFIGNQELYEAEYLKTFTKDGYEDFVAVLRMTTIHKELMEQKAFYHMTGNNINHPSDFLVRIYAQAVLRTVLGDDRDI